MRLTERAAKRLLGAHDHGVLSTVHARRGVDAVPVVYVAAPEGFVGIPIDRIKQKSPGMLQRERNLAADSRASLLVEHWDRDDWSALWWVRAELRWDATPDAARDAVMSTRLADRFQQYRAQPFDRILALRIVAVTGWAAGPSMGRAEADERDTC